MSTVTGTIRSFSYTLETTANKERFWHVWTDVENWPTWDTPLREVRLEGNLQQGATGKLTTQNGQVSSFTISECTPMQSYSFTTQLPGAKLVVRRYISKESLDKLQFTHHVSFEGPLAFLFAGLLGKGFTKALPPVMENLKRIAEGSAV
jgi:Polyketide cyclase / dehydrase and lipid transport